MVYGAGTVVLIWSAIIGLRGSIRGVADDIQPIESLRWSRSAAVRGALIGLAIGLVWWFIRGFDTRAWLFAIRTEADLRWLLWSVLTGIISGFFLMGMQAAAVEAKIRPNQGIRLSAKYAALFTTIAVLCTLIAVPPMERILLNSSNPQPFIWWSFTMAIALWFGGLEVIRHYTLRFMLWRQGRMPWNYARFLDHCVDLVFLRRVGGGYIFIHRYLMEYFASLEPEQQGSSKTRLTN